MEQTKNSGAIFRSAQKEGANANAPAYSGTATINEKKYRIAGWVNKSKNNKNYLRLIFTEVIEQDLNVETHQPIITLGGSAEDNFSVNDLPF